MIPTLAPKPKKPQTPEEYRVERDKAASDVIAASMEKTLHGNPNQNAPRADVEYDPFAK